MPGLVRMGIMMRVGGGDMVMLHEGRMPRRRHGHCWGLMSKRHLLSNFSFTLWWEVGFRVGVCTGMVKQSLNKTKLSAKKNIGNNHHQSNNFLIELYMYRRQQMSLELITEFEWDPNIFRKSIFCHVDYNT